MKFRHNITDNEHPKMVLLTDKYGFAGYGRFIVLYGLIGKTPSIDKNSVAKYLQMSSAELNEFLSFLASPEIGVIKITGNSIALNPDPALYEAAE